MAIKSLPIACPSCGQGLKVRRLECAHCATAVEGDFDFPLLALLNGDDQDFVVNFVKGSGNLKELAKLYGVSYPTVRNRLDALINRISELQQNKEDQSQ